MFPYFSMPTSLYSYDAIQNQNLSSFDPNNFCSILPNYFYFAQTPYAYHNFALNELYSTTLDQKHVNSNFSSTRDEFTEKISVLKI